jgi:Kef-type K+ transport system membrane component KefB
MFASHTLVAYPVITKLGLTQNKAVITTVGGTIITDTVALLLLAVIASGYQGDLDMAFWLNMGLMLLLYGVSIIGLVPKLSKWFFRNIEDESLEFTFALLLAFGLSYLARVMGIEPIVGAFFVGLVMNRLIPKSSPLMNRVQFVGNTLFIPFFLLYIGLLVDISVLTSSITAWIVMGAMLGANVITKLIASKFTQRYFKFSSDEGWVMFGLSTTEAAATLAATLVGYDLGIIGDEVLNGVIMMILVTCIMGPIIVEKFGKNIAVKEKYAPVKQEDRTDRILVPLANPESSPSLSVWQPSSIEILMEQYIPFR